MNLHHHVRASAWDEQCAPFFPLSLAAVAIRAAANNARRAAAYLQGCVRSSSVSVVAWQPLFENIRSSRHDDDDIGCLHE